MRVRTLGPGDEARLEDFLRPYVDSSLFLLSNSRQVGFLDHGERFEGTYLAALEDGQIVGVVAQYWQGSLIFQAPLGLNELVAAHALAPRRPIRGLLGPASQVQQAKEQLGFEAAQVQLDEQEGLYSLLLRDLIVPEDLRSGRLGGRRIELRDLDLVTRFRVDYQLELLGAEDSAELRATCRTDLEVSLERGDTWVLEDAGQVVASTSFNAVIAEAVQVGGVWTPPAHRGRGYGRSVVAVSLLDARQQGVERSVLFTGEDNVGARKAYAALGFQRIGDYRIVILRG